MRTIAFPISRKENEKRRAILPEHIKSLTNPENIWIEKAYGEVLGISDREYASCGCYVGEFDEIIKADVICDPKVGDANYLEQLNKGQIIFGWVHATQNKDITDAIVNSGLTAYAWEHMYDNKRHIFWRNNELAGEAAVLHAFQCYGTMPYETKVAIIGRGNTARGAYKILSMLGAYVQQYDRNTEELLREELYKFDVIVNCVLWDITRKDHIISRSDLRRMKKGSMIIDVSCDRNGGIETCMPTTIEAPVYIESDIVHYAVDHTPALFFKTFSYENSKILTPYIELLMKGESNAVLDECLIIQNGNIIDKEIIDFQGRY